MKTTLTIKWLMILILALPMFNFAQTSKSGNQHGETILSRSQNKNEDAFIASPAGTDNDGLWVHYDDVENYDSWGFLISGEIYDIVAKWDPADLTSYNGWVISKIKFIVTNNEPIYKVKVWQGPDATEIYSQDVDAVNVNSWTEITLDTPVEIDASTELWAGYNVDYSSSELGGFVTATDDGPPVDEYGNLCRLNGTWYSEYNNHNLQIYIESNLNADFESDVTTICEGSSVNFLDQSSNATSWSWTFEGGTPATSTEQNPTVVYSTAGVYDVSLTVSDGQDVSTMTNTDFITVVVTPDQADMPSGDDELCSGLTYEYSTNPVINAESYDWSVTPESAGTLIGDEATVYFEVSDTYSGSFSISVRAWNICDFGPWSDEFTGTINLSPAEFELFGSGEICEGDPGIEIILLGSEVGVDYELFNNQGPTGIIIPGTGEAISFGLFTEQNNYSAVGFIENCSTDMIGEGSVQVNQLPEQLSIPDGSTEVCNIGENVYTTTNAQTSDIVIWTLSPENAGAINSDGMTATINWNSTFEGISTLSVLAENACGTGPASDALEIMVMTSPTPDVSGDDLVCKEEVSIYSTTENAGNIYDWEVMGGEITAGQGTSEIAVTWGITPGQGYVIVDEALELGCSTIDSLSVIIDDCTGVSDNIQDNKLTISPNPVTGNSIDITKGNSGFARIQIISASGSLVGEYEMDGNRKQIDITRLQNGLYFVKVVDEMKNTTLKKFIKN
jgi:PKD repeat protein